MELQNRELASVIDVCSTILHSKWSKTQFKQNSTCEWCTTLDLWSKVYLKHDKSLSKNPGLYTIWTYFKKFSIFHNTFLCTQNDGSLVATPVHANFFVLNIKDNITSCYASHDYHMLVMCYNTWLASWLWPVRILDLLLWKTVVGLIQLSQEGAPARPKIINTHTFY